MIPITAPNWQDRWATAPPWATFLGFALPTGILFGIVMGFTDGIGLLGGLAMGVFFGLLFGLFMTYWTRRSQHRSGFSNAPATEKAALAHALRTGEPPADPSLDQPLRRMGEHSRRELRTAQRFNPILFGFLALVSLLIYLDDGKPYRLGLAATFAALLAYHHITAKRALARLTALEAALARRADPDDSQRS